MTVFRFNHPSKEITYTWNLADGLLYRNEADPIGMDRSTQVGELFYRFLNFKIVDRWGLSKNADEEQRDLTVRSYLQRLVAAIDAEAERTAFIKTIPNRGGYQWLLDVEKLEKPESKEETLIADDLEPEALKSLDAPLFLEGEPDDSRRSGPLFRHVIDAAALVQEKTRDFVGREHIFGELDGFIEDKDCGYFVIEGDPGIGKTSLMAHLTLERRCVHHFNVRGEGVNRADAFLRNLCAQLILKYRLDHRDLPPEAGRDAAFLKRLLAEVAAKLEDDQHALILVDALDEVEGMEPAANTLFLPLTLPRGIFFALTARRTDQVKLRIEAPVDLFDIEHDGERNLRDVKRYIVKKIDLPGLDIYIEKEKLDRPGFIDAMVEKSDGNFMYLRHVLPEIAKGAYRNRPIEYMPIGLKGYYEDHWQRMRGINEEAWRDYRLPVVLALVIVREPVSIELIGEFSGVADQSRIRRVLMDWREFLHIRMVALDDGRQKRFRIYHASYQDFINDKDEVRDKAAERGVKSEVDLKHAHKKVADVLIKDLIDAGILDQNFNSDDATPASSS